VTKNQFENGNPTSPVDPAGPVIHFTELAPAPADGPLAVEWETFRRELPRLLADGLAGAYALVVGSVVVGTFDTFAGAVAEGRRRFPERPLAVQLIAEWQPVIRPSGGIRWAAWDCALSGRARPARAVGD